MVRMNLVSCGTGWLGSLWAQEGRERSSEGEAPTNVEGWERNGEGTDRDVETHGDKKESQKKRGRETEMNTKRKNTRDRDKDTNEDGDRLPETARDEDRGTDWQRQERDSQ